jgi:hypothetical protein
LGLWEARSRQISDLISRFFMTPKAQADRARR